MPHDARQLMLRRSLLALLVLLIACRRERDAPAVELTFVDPPAEPGAMGVNLVVAGNKLRATWIERTGDAARLRFATWDGAWGRPATIAESAKIVANWADFPSVAGSGDGTLLAHFAEQAGAEKHAYHVILARSVDDGATWQRLGAPHADGSETEHGFVSLVGEGDSVRAFWLDGREMIEGGSGRTTLRTATVESTVQGEELVDPSVCDCCGTSAAMTDAGPIIVYRDRTDDEVRDIWIVRRTQGGWSEPAPVHLDGWRIPGCPVNGPAVAAQGSRVVVAWYTYVGGRAMVRASFSSDAGATFSAPIDVDVAKGRSAPTGRVDVVLDGRDGAIVSWAASDRERGAIMARRVTTDGRLGAPKVITPTRPDRDAGFPRLERVGSQLAFAWTEPGEASRIRVALVSPDVLPAVGGQGDRVGEAAVEKLAAVGAPLPPLEATDVRAGASRLSDLRGQPVLINVWATWCEPCRHELPELARLHEKTGLRVVAISVDQRVSTAEVRAFADRRKLPFAVWHDPADRVSSLLGVSTLPASFLFAADGKLVWRREGAITADDAELAAALSSLGVHP